MKEIIISILMLLGSLFILIASIGFLRLKDIYSRIHAITKASSLGIILLLVAVSIFFGSTTIVVKSILIIIFIFLTSPLAAHSIVKSFRTREKE